MGAGLNDGRIPFYYTYKIQTMIRRILFLCVLMLALHDYMHAQYLHRVSGGSNTLLPYSGDDSLAINANYSNVFELCVDKAGNIYVGCDALTYPSGFIRKISKATSIITRVAGGGSPGSTGEGLAATAAHIHDTPRGICMDTAGNLLFTDSCRVRRLNMATGLLTTIAGTGIYGHSGDGSPATAAEFISPSALAVDSANNLYIADGGNYNIRRVDATTGLITTIAGNWKSSAESGDGGPATAAELWQPSGLYIDQPGKIYIVDGIMVRVIDPATGIINAFAGTASGGLSDLGTTGPATALSLRFPNKIAGDKNGNVYITSFGGPWLRKVNIATGIMSVYGGNDTGSCEIYDEGQPATSGAMVGRAICVDSCGNVYATTGVILWKLTPGPDDVECGINPALTVSATAYQVNEITVFPNPANDNFTIQLPSSNESAHIVITNAFGKKVRELYVPSGIKQNIRFGEPPGNYFINVQSGRERWCRRVVISQ